MSRSDIHLDGGEIAVVKALGLSGTEASGEDLMGRIPDIMFAELMDTLYGLVSMGYVDADKSSFHNREEFEKTRFRVNSGYAHDLKEALSPKVEPKKSRRVRRE